MTTAPLVAAGALDAIVARRDGFAISRRQYIADAGALALRLPESGAMLNLSVDRYRFAVGLGAALLRGHTSLLPPNHTGHTVERLRARFGDTYALVEDEVDSHGLPTIAHAPGYAAIPGALANPGIATDAIAAYVLTSGSTGDPLPHAKPWGGLVASARVEGKRLGGAIGRDSLAGVSLVATVPAQHMYGFESSVLIALHGGAAFDAARPFYPADIVAALERTPSPRMLVTTPFHLKTLLESGVALPRLDLVLCATAPLSPQLAARAESAFAAPLVEIYGCTEAGQVASRRTTDGPEWRTLDDVVLNGDGNATIASGGHVPQATPLADVLEVIDSATFRLLGRSNDLVNIAGKRSSIGHLNFHLNAIEGVVDGSFWMPPENDHAPGVARLVAFVVAPAATPEDIRAALRSRIDAAFLPRRIVHVEALPREATGKLASARLAAFAAAHRRVMAPLPTNASAPSGRIVRRVDVGADHPAFAGHFPGRPVWPGVALVAEVLEAARAEPELARRIGSAPRLGVVKFLAPVLPGARLEIEFRDVVGGIEFSVSDGGRIAASGRFSNGDAARSAP